MEEQILLNDNDLAIMFGVAKSTVRVWKSRKQIPQEVMFKLPGTQKGTVRFIKSKVIDWVNGRLENNGCLQK